MDNIIMIVHSNMIDLTHIAEDILFVGLYVIDLPAQVFNLII